MVRALIFAAALLVAGCNAAQISGIAAGFHEDSGRIRAPLADASEASFAFQPLPGIPGNLADDMLRRLWDRAEQEGLIVVKRPGGASRFEVDGTLQAVSNDSNALIFYVFDVRDVSGRRLHRISGRQPSNASLGDPWAAVDDRALDAIAVRVAALLKAWLHAYP